MSTDIHAQRILILDFGSQYTQLIARRIREQHVYCEIQPPTVGLEEVRAWNPAGIVLSGGPSSVLDVGAPDVDPGIVDLGVPVLGICYGLQLLAHRLGGLVEKADDHEYGRALLKVEREDPLFANLAGGAERVVWMSHGDRVLRLPEGFQVLGTSQHSPFAAIRHSERPVWGVQFHPEVVHTYDNILKAVAIFRERRYGALPVLDKEQSLVGILSAQDLLLALEELVQQAKSDKARKKRK